MAVCMFWRCSRAVASFQHPSTSLRFYHAVSKWTFQNLSGWLNMHSNMNRRNFFKLAGASTSYSVFVNARGLGQEAAAAAPPPVAQTAALPGTARFDGEPNMSL